MRHNSLTLADADTDRAMRIARSIITRFSIDLRGMHVVTEAATGHFRWTPVLALMAGAHRVTAVGKDSPYGSAEEACRAVAELAAHSGWGRRLEVLVDHESAGGTLEAAPADALAEADIVTNLSSLRPFDSARLRSMRPGTALPLMCETWEYREEDLDLGAAFTSDVIVLGTNEHHPALNFMRYVGLLAVKLALDSELELYRSRILVVGGGEFGNAAVAALRANGAEVNVICPIQDAAHMAGNVSADNPGEGPGEMTCYPVAETLSAPEAEEHIAWADLILFADYTTENLHIGKKGSLTASTIARMNPAIRVAHISGAIEPESLRGAGLRLLPGRVVAGPRRMSVTTAHLGVRPVIELHGAGLKVGEVIARAWRRSGGSSLRARNIALLNPLCQEFPAGILERCGVTGGRRDAA